MTVKQGFDALKSTAQTMGSTSVRLQRVVSGNASDFSVSTTYNVIHGWEIVFTPDPTSLPGTGLLWHLFINGFNVVGTGQQVTYIELVSIIDNVWTERFWAIGTSPSASLSYDVLVTIYAMSQGSISVSQIQ